MIAEVPPFFVRTEDFVVVNIDSHWFRNAYVLSMHCFIESTTYPLFFVHDIQNILPIFEMDLSAVTAAEFFESQNANTLVNYRNNQWIRIDNLMIPFHNEGPMIQIYQNAPQNFRDEIQSVLTTDVDLHTIAVNILVDFLFLSN